MYSKIFIGVLGFGFSVMSYLYLRKCDQCKKLTEDEEIEMKQIKELVVNELKEIETRIAEIELSIT